MAAEPGKGGQQGPGTRPSRRRPGCCPAYGQAGRIQVCAVRKVGEEDGRCQRQWRGSGRRVRGTGGSPRPRVGVRCGPGRRERSVRRQRTGAGAVSVGECGPSMPLSRTRSCRPWDWEARQGAGGNRNAHGAYSQHLLQKRSLGQGRGLVALHPLNNEQSTRQATPRPTHPGKAHTSDGPCQGFGPTPCHAAFRDHALPGMCDVPTEGTGHRRVEGLQTVLGQGTVGVPDAAAPHVLGGEG